ncbi:endoribonuclease L-PSP [Paenibacillus swuensis]|uniref:Endoribonuclease L-PSP n=1 Tax=Paenibacillus swuensis TaxID=1178515 RepID=A0A172TJ96_9BACL|nr:RidA family protein [Paenibacillus swuensis]ANE47108.1 endoribonuclease L-PSP [Paenibacillus swuensis]
MSVYARLEQLGLNIPDPPAKGGIYAKIKQTGNLVYTSGQGPMLNGKVVKEGKLGVELTVEEGQEMARIAVLNCLSVLEEGLGSLERISQIVKILGFVNSGPGFNNQPLVINGASQLLLDLFGENGEHARSAVGTNELPLNFPVEIEMIVELSAD